MCAHGDLEQGPTALILVLRRYGPLDHAKGTWVKMTANFEEGVDWLHKYDADDGKGEVDDHGEYLVVEDFMVCWLNFVEEAPERPKYEDDKREGKNHDSNEEVIDVACYDLHASRIIIILNIGL